MFDRFYTRRKWFLAIVAGALGIFTAAQAGYAQGTWTTLAPVSPSPTEGMTVGGVGQVIIGAYGFSSSLGGNTNQTRLYNISTDSWSTGAAAPLPARADAASGDTTHGGFLYVIGGGNSPRGFPPLPTHHSPPGIWGTLISIAPAPPAGAAGGVCEGVFVLCGRPENNGPPRWGP